VTSPQAVTHIDTLCREDQNNLNAEFVD
jgi:hypothetical protein